ncbi:MAG: hypothetical protein IKJ01_08540, partial [Lachnospiraceae bacterium]|nr:hypothetical protein [Lachnospiraceae bacterium]
MKKDYYVDGNTIRELYPKQAEPEKKVVPDKESPERSQRKKIRKNAVKRNRQKELYMNRNYVGFLSVCVGLVAISSVSLIRIQSQLTQRKERIAALESQITNLKATNDAKYKDIITNVDLEYIKDTAVNELGMSYAAENQLIYYTVDN